MTSTLVADDLYNTDFGASTLARFDFDPATASAFTLGCHMMGALPPVEQERLRRAWKDAPDRVLLDACGRRSGAPSAGAVVRAFRESMESDAPAPASERQWPL